MRVIRRSSGPVERLWGSLPENHLPAGNGCETGGGGAIEAGIAVGIGADDTGADGMGADGMGADGMGADGIGADGIGADGIGADRKSVV